MIKTDAKRDAAAVDDINMFRTESGADDAMVQAYAIERSIENNYLPTMLKSELEINPQNPAFLGAVALYDQFETQQPDFIGKHIDSDTVRDVLSYKRALVETGNQQKALEKIGNSDWSLVKSTLESVKAEARQEVMDKLADGPLWFEGVKDSPRIRGMIKEDFDYYTSRGLTVRDAIASSIANLHPSSGRTIEVGGHLYKNNEGWDHKADLVADFIMTKYAAEKELFGWFEPDNEPRPDAGQVSMSPIPNKEGWVRIAPVGPLALLGSVTERSIDSLYDEFSAAEKQAAIAAQAVTADEVTEKAKAILTPFVGSRSLTPMSLAAIFDPTREWALQQREDNWNELSPAQQELLKRRARN